MNFEHPWILVFLALLPLWILAAWRGTRSRHLLILKVLSIALLTFALAMPSFRYDDHAVALAVIADTSASLTPDDLKSETQTIRAIVGHRGSNSVTVLPFASTTRSLTPAERNGTLAYSSSDGAHATDIERAIREGISALPGGAVRRVALLSDGNENSGSVARAIWQAQRLGIPIDTFPVAGSKKPGLHVESVSAPASVFSGERFPVELTLTSPQQVLANVELTAEARILGNQSVSLAQGENRVRLRAVVNTTGAIVLNGKITAENLGATSFQYAMTIRRPRVLLLSEDPATADEHLAQLLQSNQFEVNRGSRSLPADLAAYQLIIYNNWDMQSVPVTEQSRLETFVKHGGGLLWIAGEKNVYVDKKDAPEDPLARSLPAKLAPPRSPEGTCVILIIDKSSSMEGKKMDLARLASIGVVENLKPQDYVAILIFDNSFQWAVPMRKAEDRALIKRLISGITPDGGTQIAPALAEAYHKITPVNAVYKHIVLLTDGISEEGDSLTLAHEAAASRVTISTVGLGQDVNRAYLEKIAANSKGKSYFLIEPSGLEQILLKDVREHTGATAVEKPLKAEVKHTGTAFDGVNMENAPPLKGYVKFEARPDADEILTLDRDPLLTRWQFGLGRSAVWASDVKNRWASSWLTWKDFDRFWTNVLRDLLPHAPPSETTTEYDPATGDLIVTYQLGRQTIIPGKIPEVYVLGPNQFRRPAQVSKVGGNSYRARAHVGTLQGLFRVRPLTDERAFPEVGFYRSEAELSDFGTNESLLRQVAESTGGRFAPTPRQVFDSGGRGTPASLRFWPALLTLALILNFAELFARKWKGLREWLPARAMSHS